MPRVTSRTGQDTLGEKMESIPLTSGWIMVAGQLDRTALPTQTHKSNCNSDVSILRNVGEFSQFRSPSLELLTCLVADWSGA